MWNTPEIELINSNDDILENNGKIRFVLSPRKNKHWKTVARPMVEYILRLNSERERRLKFVFAHFGILLFGVEIRQRVGSGVFMAFGCAIARMLLDVLNHFTDHASELVLIERVIGEFLVRCSERWMLPFVLWIDFVGVFPGEVLDTTESSEILIAVFIFAVVNLEDGCPVG